MSREIAKAHLWQAAALGLYTGQRLIAAVQGKTGKKLWIPIHKELAALLALLGRCLDSLGAAGSDLDQRSCHEPILRTSRGWSSTMRGR